MADNNLNINLTVPPPPGPPPLLSPNEIRHLAVNGWLPLTLSPDFTLSLTNLSDSASAFFSQITQKKKAQYPPARGTECGFYHIPTEKEYLTLRYASHADPDLERHVRDVWRQASILLHRILADLGRAGGFTNTAWDTLLEDTLNFPKDSTGVESDEILTFMRLFNYFPHGGFAAEHVDLGLLTLCIGSGRGLQVLERTTTQDAAAQQWLDAPGPTVVVGDFLRALLKNRVRAGSHRVVSNPHGRTSIIFALRPCLRHMTMDLGAFGESGVVDTREFYERIKGGKFNVNARREVRERQQEAQSKRKARMEKIEKVEKRSSGRG